MKIRRINKVTSLAVVLLAAGLLISCKPIFEKKPIPKEGDKAAAAAPAAPAAAPAPAPAAAPAPAPEPVPAPAAKIEEVKSLESTAESVAAAEPVQSTPMVDDGNDVVKVTPDLMRKIQQALVNAGYNPGPVDGVSGAKTTTAIESFQKKNGIPTGKITKKTLRALGVDF